MDLAQRPWMDKYDPGTQTRIDAPPWETIGDLVRRSAAENGDRVAFRTVLPNGMAGAATFAEVADRSAAFAGYLREVLKLEPGERVAIQSPNCLAYPVVAFGTALAGLVLVNINPLYTADEITAVLQDARPKVVVAIDIIADRLDAALKRAPVEHVIVTRIADFFAAKDRLFIGLVQKYVRRQIPRVTFRATRLTDALRQGAGHSRAFRDGQDRAATGASIACLQYTGGTTGISKGAMLTHRNLLINVAQFHCFRDNGLRRDDILLTALPLYHIFAFTVNLISGFAIGAENILVPSPRPLSNLKPVFADGGPTFMTGVNTLFNGLLNEAWFRDLPRRRLRKSVAGGMALQGAVAERWLEVTGTPVVEGYGLTEASPVVTFNPFRGAKPGSIGIPLPQTDIRIVGEDGRDMPVGQPGELAVQGPQVMLGYWERPDETEKVLRYGWLFTGDVAVIDEDGFLFIVDRLKDMILVSGFNVFPTEVEDVIARLAGVRECAVIGVPDEASGEVPRAFVVRSDPALTSEAVRTHCRAHLAAYKVPRTVEFREELPKTPVGKILRRALRT